MEREGLLKEVSPDKIQALLTNPNDRYQEFDSLYFERSKFEGDPKAFNLLKLMVNSEDPEPFIVRVNHASEEQNQERMERRFQDYHNEIRNSRSEHHLLVAIARLIRALGVGHYFRDANRRASVFLYMNKLLFQAGFFPAIMEDPSLFDSRVPLSEIVTALKKGIEKTQDVTLVETIPEGDHDEFFSRVNKWFETEKEIELPPYGGAAQI